MTHVLIVSFTPTGMPITWGHYSDSAQAYRDGRALLRAGGIHAYSVCRLSE